MTGMKNARAITSAATAAIMKRPMMAHRSADGIRSENRRAPTSLPRAPLLREVAAERRADPEELSVSVGTAIHLEQLG